MLDAAPTPSDSPARPDRPGWMGLLARATRGELEVAAAALSPLPPYRLVRRPECGLAMVRGRAGGVGNPFNLGEMTMTRCAVGLEDGSQTIGLSYVAGRDTRRAELAALFDALLQATPWAEAVRAGLLAEVGARLDRDRRMRAAESAATRVEFFTLVREQGNG